MNSQGIAAARLYGFIDTAYLGKRDAAEVARTMIDGGVDIIQFRAKDMTRPQRVALGMAVLGVAQPRNVPVIINDDIDAAAEINADGVHLGQEDWAAVVGQASRLSRSDRELVTGEPPVPPKLDRLANMRIVGISTHSLEQALRAERDGATYIGVGPIFATATKPGVKPVGLELIRQVQQRVAIPFFAIGGITLDNIGEVLAAGAERVAVVSAILKSSDVRQTASAFKRKLGLKA